MGMGGKEKTTIMKGHNCILSQLSYIHSSGNAVNLNRCYNLKHVIVEMPTILYLICVKCVSCNFGARSVSLQLFICEGKQQIRIDILLSV
jgi:hypothetical protein